MKPIALSSPWPALLLGVFAAAAPGQVTTKQGLVYPEGSVVPRHASGAELRWLSQHPMQPPTTRGPGDVPQGSLSCPGEYAPCEGIIFAYEGGATLNAIQHTMIRWITTSGNAKAYVSFDDVAEQNTAMNAIQAAGANMARVVPIIRTTDAIWIRDYGPRYTYEADVRVISDHTYNRTTRVNDNAFPLGWAPFRKHALYTLPLIHGGGNYHLNSIGEGFATQLIVNENPGRSATQIVDLWRQHWGPTTILTLPFPTAVDATQHIDMWMQILGDRQVFISDWPSNVGSTQDVICDSWATNLTNAGWQVIRLPARSVGGVHYTYTNMVICNDLALIPSYTNATVSPHNAAALAAYQAALPGKTIVQVPSDALASLAGVMHCIVMHVPKHRGVEVAGGQAPTAYLRSPNGGQSFIPGQTHTIRWITDDDESVTNVDLHWSIDGGATWSNQLLTAATDTGSYNWTIPEIYSTAVRVRITARDAQGRTGADHSDANFSILGAHCAADLDNDGVLDIGVPDGAVDVNDLIYFLAAFEAGSPASDVNEVPGSDIDDLIFFLTHFEQGC
jgi:agmatine deiminase